MGTGNFKKDPDTIQYKRKSAYALTGKIAQDRVNKVRLNINSKFFKWQLVGCVKSKFSTRTLEGIAV